MFILARHLLLYLEQNQVKWLKRIGIIFTSLLLLGIGSIAAAYFYVLPDLPNVATLKTIQLQTPLRIYSSDGKLISQFGEKRRIPLKLEQIPKPLGREGNHKHTCIHCFQVSTEHSYHVQTHLRLRQFPKQC